jgi:hypothetical protein
MALQLVAVSSVYFCIGFVMDDSLPAVFCIFVVFQFKTFLTMKAAVSLLAVPATNYTFSPPRRFISLLTAAFASALYFCGRKSL